MVVPDLLPLHYSFLDQIMTSRLLAFLSALLLLAGLARAAEPVFLT
jgi:hypothetical protein